MYFWIPQENQIYMLYLISIIWGIGTGAWQSQVVGNEHFQIEII